MRFQDISDESLRSYTLFTTLVDELIRSGQMPLDDIVDMLCELRDRGTRGLDCIGITDEQISDEVYTHYDSIKGDDNTIEKRNISRDVEYYVSEMTGTFQLQTMYRDLSLTSTNDKTTARKAIQKLCNLGSIERYGSQSGVYRPKSITVNYTNFIEGEIKEFPIFMPIQLNEICAIYPGNVIVIAGSKSAGKTTTAMRIAFDNQHRLPIDYLNCEMGDIEFTKRCKGFGVTSADQIKFRTIECKENYHDFVTAEKKIFIVDFLEVGDNFWEVGQKIKLIHDKLKDGIAIICMQKGFDSQLARGGTFSLDKARLYLSLDYNERFACTRVTIVDAKFPKIPGNIKFAYRDVKIVEGSRLSPITSWIVPKGARAQNNEQETKQAVQGSVSPPPFTDS